MRADFPAREDCGPSRRRCGRQSPGPGRCRPPWRFLGDLKSQQGIRLCAEIGFNLSLDRASCHSFSSFHVTLKQSTILEFLSKHAAAAASTSQSSFPSFGWSSCGGNCSAQTALQHGLQCGGFVAPVNMKMTCTAVAGGRPVSVMRSAYNLPTQFLTAMRPSA